jgi:hypothetical protein
MIQIDDAMPVFRGPVLFRHRYDSGAIIFVIGWFAVIIAVDINYNRHVSRFTVWTGQSALPHKQITGQSG